jgi:starvation-inducible DNA-binding protein
MKKIFGRNGVGLASALSQPRSSYPGMPMVILSLMVGALSLGFQARGQEASQKELLEKLSSDALQDTIVKTSGTPSVAKTTGSAAAQEVLNIGINQEERRGVIDIVRKLHADEFVLYTKTLNFHWNVYGLHFNDLHALFKSQYEALFKIVDDLAERTRTLGSDALGSLEEFSKIARISNAPVTALPAPAMLKALLEDHETMIRNLRSESALVLEEFNDSGTNNFLIDIMNRHEKTAWMLRAAIK